MAEETDEALADRARRGDRAAFGALVERYQDRVYSLARHLLDDPVAAEDAAQEVFLRAWRALGSFRGESRFSTWLYRVAANACLNARRDRGRERAVSLESVVPNGTLHAEEPGGLERAERSEARRAVLRAVRTLPEEFRIVVTLRYGQDLSYDEIAAALDIPRSTVGTRLWRAHQLLRSALAAELEEGHGLSGRR